jgi:CheY-like chemotaxis protein
VRRFVERVLREAGYTTAVAADGAEAIQIAATLDPFDLVVTDVMMPRMSGDELARRLRSSRPALKVLYLTGFSDRLFKDKVTLWEDEAFLEKPCNVKVCCRPCRATVGRVNAPDESRPERALRAGRRAYAFPDADLFKDILHRHEGAALAERALFGAPVGAGAPAAGDQRQPVVCRCPLSQRRAQIDAACCVRHRYACRRR